VATGDVIHVAPPRGEFFLDEASSRPVVLLSGGVGLTPMVSMLHHLSASGARPVFFIHACENGRVHALGNEVRELAARRPGIRTHVVYRQPSDQDRQRGSFDSEGLVSRALLQQLLAIDDYEFYLCGPPPFMTAVYGLLRDLGVAPSRIAYEFFGPATVLETPATALESKAATAPSRAAMPGGRIGSTDTVSAPAGDARVTFARSGRRVVWDEAAQNLLAFAEAQGLSPAFSCRAGICGSCATALKSGDVSYIDEPLDPPQSGEILLCICRPRGDIELDL
jgi:ferredoxin-NADP reductase